MRVMRLLGLVAALILAGCAAAPAGERSVLLESDAYS